MAEPDVRKGMPPVKLSREDPIDGNLVVRIGEVRARLLR
jgi:hypothetical protein